MSSNTPILLTDEQMKRFIQDGFLILNTDFPASFHEKLVEQLHLVYQEGNPGNNLLPRVRELQQVFDHPVITGALTSVLGPDYVLHTHRHGHYNASDAPGGWHKDSYWGYRRTRNHHLHWAMVMYFPQDTPLDLGPTSVLPGTQYDETRTFPSDDPAGEAFANGAAGTFALIHYDIWHRATANRLGKPRYMLKFEFMRVRMPESPTWDHRLPYADVPDSPEPSLYRRELLWEETWNWASGQVASMANALPDDPAVIADLARRLEGDDEPDALNAAYELACRGNGGISALLQALESERKATVRIAGYGLSVAGEEAVDGLAAALDSGEEATVTAAVFALGELRHLAGTAVGKLAAMTAHASRDVRVAVVEALGLIPDSSGAAVAALVQCLQDADVQVRFTAGLSLARLGRSAEAAVPALAQALADDNRYVRGHALEALRHIDTEEARQVLLKELFNNRWCYSTTPASTF